MTMTDRLRTHLLVATVLVGLVGLSGCTTTQSTRAKALKPTVASPGQGMAGCQHLTVLPFAVTTKKSVDASVGSALAQDVERRLSDDFGPLFASVEYAPAARAIAGECVLRGEISKYRKGSKVARFIVMGLGSASLEGRVAVVDGAGATLLDAPFDKLWAWGGIAGASKGIDDMSEEVAASIASTVAQAKGWTPPAKSP
jgi:hypothetical protein